MGGQSTSDTTVEHFPITNATMLLSSATMQLCNCATMLFYYSKSANAKSATMDSLGLKHITSQTVGGQSRIQMPIDQMPIDQCEQTFSDA